MNPQNPEESGASDTNAPQQNQYNPPQIPNPAASPFDTASSVNDSNTPTSTNTFNSSPQTTTQINDVSPAVTSSNPVVSSTFGDETPQQAGTDSTAAENVGPPTPSPEPDPKPKRGKRKLIIAIVAILAVLGLTSAYVFGYYLPNTPENVWKSAVTNTGKGYDALTTYATNFNSEVDGLEMQGSYKLKGDMVSDGTMSGKSLGDNAQFSGTISASGLKIEYEVRAIKSTGDTPDYYFKVNGLQGLGTLLGGVTGPEFAQALEGVNNQWYVIDHTLFEQLASGDSSNQSMSLSTKDVEKLLNTIKNSNNTYLFTDDQTKAVFVQQEFIGKETKDNRTVYHYKAGVNQANLKLYLKALCGDLQKDTLGKTLLKDGLRATNCDDFVKKADNINTKQTADVWVDKSTKLVHTVRFTDSKQAANYLEIGQDYQGGTVYPFSLIIQEKDGKTTQSAVVKATLDTEKNTLKVSGVVDSSGESKSVGSMDMSFKPNADKSFKVEAPQGAKNIMQLVNDLGLGQLLGASQTE